MSITSQSTSARGRTGEAMPVCPACGRLQCLCRPRFFAGQLLTDEDLNRLDRYIREKSKLHNRYLHGWGVVCGLEASCDDCNSKLVRVKPGYALSPCGEDVVVCEDYAVDMCNLIRQCREPDPQDCDPYRPRRRDDCDEETEEWILAICYQEKPSRGVTALRNTGSTCSCGCSGDGACGCNSQKTSRREAQRPSSSLPRIAAQCEETVICEGYCFTAYRAPDPAVTDPIGRPQDPRGGGLPRILTEPLPGMLGERLFACLEPYTRLLEDLIALRDDERLPNDVRMQRIRAIQQRLLEVISARGLKDCTLVNRLKNLTCEDTTVVRLPEQRFRDCLIQLALIWWEGVIACLCNALLPPCPAPVENDCIPLAAVTVRKDDCRVLKVCNWTVHRKFATTWPGLQYWLSPLPIVSTLRKYIEDLCCNLDLFGRKPSRPGTIMVETTAPANVIARSGVILRSQDGAERNGTLSAAGNFVFDNVPAGTYTVEVDPRDPPPGRQGFKRSVTSVTLPDGGNESVRLVMQDLHDNPGTIVTGTAVDAAEQPGSELLAGVRVVIEGTNIRRETNHEGDFEMRDVPTGTHTISASFTGYQDFSVTTRLDANDQVYVNVLLHSVVTDRVQPRFSMKDQTLLKLAVEAFQGSATTLDPQSIFLRAGGFEVSRSQQDLSLSSTERAHFPQYLLLNQLVKPFVDGLVSFAGSGVLSNFSAARPRPAAEAVGAAAEGETRTASVAERMAGATLSEAEQIEILQQKLQTFEEELVNLRERVAGRDDFDEDDSDEADYDDDRPEA